MSQQTNRAPDELGLALWCLCSSFVLVSPVCEASVFRPWCHGGGSASLFEGLITALLCYLRAQWAADPLKVRVIVLIQSFSLIRVLIILNLLLIYLLPLLGGKQQEAVNWRQTGLLLHISLSSPLSPLYPVQPFQAPCSQPFNFQLSCLAEVNKFTNISCVKKRTHHCLFLSVF